MFKELIDLTGKVFLIVTPPFNSVNVPPQSGVVGSILGEGHYMLITSKLNKNWFLMAILRLGSRFHPLSSYSLWRLQWQQLLWQSVTVTVLANPDSTGCPKVRVKSNHPLNFGIGRRILKPFGMVNAHTVKFDLVYHTYFYVAKCPGKYGVCSRQNSE